MENMAWEDPWQPINEPSPHLINELEKELASDHPLYKKKVKPVALGWSGDDVLFEIEDSGEYAVVHLTWSGKVEPSGFPDSEFFRDWDDFFERRLKPDSIEYVDQ